MSLREVGIPNLEIPTPTRGLNPQMGSNNVHSTMHKKANGLNKFIGTIHQPTSINMITVKILSGRWNLSG